MRASGRDRGVVPSASGRGASRSKCRPSSAGHSKSCSLVGRVAGRANGTHCVLAAQRLCDCRAPRAAVLRRERDKPWKQERPRRCGADVEIEARVGCAYPAHVGAELVDAVAKEQDKREREDTSDGPEDVRGLEHEVVEARTRCVPRRGARGDGSHCDVPRSE